MAMFAFFHLAHSMLGPNKHFHAQPQVSTISYGLFSDTQMVCLISDHSVSPACLNGSYIIEHKLNNNGYATLRVIGLIAMYEFVHLARWPLGQNKHFHALPKVITISSGPLSQARMVCMVCDTLCPPPVQKLPPLLIAWQRVPMPASWREKVEHYASNYHVEFCSCLRLSVSAAVWLDGRTWQTATIDPVSHSTYSLFNSLPSTICEACFSPGVGKIWPTHFARCTALA